MSSNTPLNYKEALEELERIVGDIEQGKPDVDELSNMVHRSVDLIKQCKEKLRNTEANLNETLDGME